MYSRSRVVCFTIVILILSAAGCSVSSPILPGTDALTNTGQVESGTHRLVSSGWLQLTPDRSFIEIVPDRGIMSHWNSTILLEEGPCDNCLRLENLQKLGASEWIFDLVAVHPADSANLRLTAFDLRAILMFEPTDSFVDSGLTWSNPSMLGGNLKEPDGYTILFSPQIFNDYDPFNNYYHGKYASPVPPSAMLNPYKNFVIPTERNHLLPGAETDVTLNIRMPEGTNRIAYAIDASWEPPVTDPPINIPDDFGISANMPEPYAVIYNENFNTLYYQDSVANGGELNFNLNVYDWQDSVLSTVGATISTFSFECPDLFTVEEATPVSTEFGFDYVPYTTYEFQISTVPSDVGTYPMLIKVEGTEPGPLEGFNATAYQVAYISVSPDPVNLPPVADPYASDPVTGPMPLTVTFDASNSSDPDGSIVLYEWDLDNDGTYEISSGNPNPFGWIFDTQGSYVIRLRVTDDGGLTDTEVLPITVGPPLNMPPEADLSNTTPDNGPAPLQVTLDGSLSDDEDGVILKWEWDTDGDGTYEFTLGSDAPIIYTYTSAGDYDLVLRVTDDDGATDTDTISISVT